MSERAHPPARSETLFSFPSIPSQHCHLVFASLLKGEIAWVDRTTANRRMGEHEELPTGAAAAADGPGAPPGKLYHDVQPDDTVQSICAKYGCNATQLRKANNFKGGDLPARLVIPKSRNPATAAPPRSRRLTLEVDEDQRAQLSQMKRPPS